MDGIIVAVDLNMNPPSYTVLLQETNREWSTDPDHLKYKVQSKRIYQNVCFLYTMYSYGVVTKDEYKVLRQIRKMTCA